MIIQEGKLKFKFEFKAIKLDDSLYYRNSFTKIQKGLKGKLKSITDGQNIKVVSKDNLKNLPWSVAIATT